MTTCSRCYRKSGPRSAPTLPVGEKLLDEIAELCDTIERTLEAGEPVQALLDRWHSHARRRTDTSEFQTYWKAVSRDTFIQKALNPVPSFDTAATYSEALAVLDAVSSASIPEAEVAYYTGWLEAQFPAARILELIYWPDEWFGDATLFRGADGTFKPQAELSSDQILGYAMATSGRTLPGSSTDVQLPFPVPESK